MGAIPQRPSLSSGSSRRSVRLRLSIPQGESFSCPSQKTVFARVRTNCTRCELANPSANRVLRSASGKSPRSYPHTRIAGRNLTGARLIGKRPGLFFVAFDLFDKALHIAHTSATSARSSSCPPLHIAQQAAISRRSAMASGSVAPNPRLYRSHTQIAAKNLTALA
jgi:hypothetical protein